MIKFLKPHFKGFIYTITNKRSTLPPPNAQIKNTEFVTNTLMIATGLQVPENFSTLVVYLAISTEGMTSTEMKLMMKLSDNNG